jgi:hypothetical protein
MPDEQNSQMSAKYLDLIEALARQHCFTDQTERTYQGSPEVMVTDSGALAANAAALRMLAEHGRFRIVRECGRMVLGYWPEHDPESGAVT